MVSKFSVDFYQDLSPFSVCPSSGVLQPGLFASSSAFRHLSSTVHSSVWFDGRTDAKRMKTDFSVVLSATSLDASLLFDSVFELKLDSDSHTELHVAS